MACRYNSAISQFNSATAVLRAIVLTSGMWLLPLQLQAADDNLKSLFNFQTRMASQGHTEAMIKLGEMHEEGLGTEKSEERAREWYAKARDNGNPEGQLHLDQLEKKREREAQEQAAREQAAREQAAREQEIAAEREAAGKREAAKRDMSPEEKARAREEAIRRAEEAYQQSLEKQIEKEKAESEALKRSRGASSNKN